VNDMEPPISEQELSELQNEAATLDIEPFDDGNLDEKSTYSELMRGNLWGAMAAAGEKANEVGQGQAPSSPVGAAAQLGEIILPALNPLGSAAAYSIPALMEATIRQHGKSPSAALQDIRINQAIIDGASNELAGEHNDG
jgi:hypothetical protein